MSGDEYVDCCKPRTSGSTRKALRVKKKILAVASAAVLGTAVYFAVPAQADVVLSTISLSTTTVVLNGDAGCANRVNVSVKVQHPSTDDSLVSVSGSATRPDGDISDFLTFLSSSRSGDTVTYKDSIFLCGFEKPGRYVLDIDVAWFGESTNEVSKQAQFYVKRPTTLTYNASPEPVKKGKSLTHSGRLMFDPFGYGGLYGPSGVKLKLMFKKAGTSTYVTKGTVTTKSGGYYSGTTKADYDGTWRMQYPTNSYRQSQDVYDAVDVK